MSDKYTPKFKTGYTVSFRWSDDCDGEYIIIDTYRGICKFIKPPFETEDDERDSETTLYAVLNKTNHLMYWRRETSLLLYCSNPNRGRRFLLEPPIIRVIRYHFEFIENGFDKFLIMLNETS